MSEPPTLLTTNRKALTINLAEARYGTFAEIGAGQEVARLFFQAGGASGTVAKTISAYDMTFSDAIYGKAPRYVSRERLLTMLDHEYALLIERLAASRGDRTAFFVFADTVAAKSYTGNNECHGWLGIRFQAEPGAAPNDIIVHVRMWDKENVLQQQALGIVGVNLTYGAFHYRDDPRRFIESLVDNVGTDRIEVDMLKFTGPAFSHIDNRLMSLHLVHAGLTNAVMFGPDGEVRQPSEVLHKKAILVERGTFRPVAHVNIDMIECAAAQFREEPVAQGKELVVLMEMTINNLLSTGEIDAADFLARVDLLGEAGYTVLISNYSEFHRLTTYFRRYTKEMIGVAMGVGSLVEIFNEKYYENLQGGVLEAIGRLFRYAVRLYIYPMRAEVYAYYHARLSADPDLPAVRLAGDLTTDAPGLITAHNLQMPEHLRHLYAHLRQNGYIEALENYSAEYLDFSSREALTRLQTGDPSWEQMVPPSVAQTIRARGLFGFGRVAVPPV